ncbi:hypothetical protein EC973_003798 [Apophysomyces ossiformis]|uniref:Uncharacterized protein n=1 Tax=Apophysomyces ossiformis TaxID=679940 RepID=A0A8H7ETE7_9FUNG|nr:hypothetical protein EC973_003798 [Apophysomyces ossiformis]
MLVVGATYLHLVDLITNIRAIERYCTHDTQKQTSRTKHKHDHPTERPRCDWTYQLSEFMLAAIQTFFMMGVMNLAGVDGYNHAIQLGLYLFVAFYLPEAYHTWLYEDTPYQVLALKLGRGLLNTAGLNALLHYLGTTIL